MSCYGRLDQHDYPVSTGRMWIGTNPVKGSGEPTPWIERHICEHRSPLTTAVLWLALGAVATWIAWSLI